MAFNKAKLQSDFEAVFESMTDGNKELANEINSFYTSGTISTDGQGNIACSSGSGAIS